MPLILALLVVKEHSGGNWWMSSVHKYKDLGMSEFAVKAYNSGLVPASKIKEVPSVLVKEFCQPVETHNTSGFFNKTKFYDPLDVRTIFGLDCSGQRSEKFNEEAARALQGWKASQKEKKYEVYNNCVVEWTEYLGKTHYPQAITKRARGVRIEIDGNVAIVHLLDGKKMKKRISGRGFRFWKCSDEGPIPEQLKFPCLKGY